jgi:hypothetical protein
MEPAGADRRRLEEVAGLLDEADDIVMVEDCHRRGHFTLRQLEWRAAARRGTGFPGSSTLGRLLTSHGSAIADSGWEVRLQELLVEAGLPRLTLQVPIDTVGGRCAAPAVWSSR